MPRVANSSRAKPISATSPQKPSQQSLLKIPLNDDRQEKAVRLQSRQALHELQMNSLRAAASPARKLTDYNRAVSDSPSTPRSRSMIGKERVEENGLPIVTASSMTPMKRLPLLANFEEWMKMATDNKINATNSWNFALIDYFHDMSLLKEGDGVNFQKASCTLDGCVKIYTSRVDSVATETGRLLSGLAESGNKKSERSTEQGDEREDEEDAEGEEGAKKKAKRKAQRSSEATLAPSFASLQLRKMELEFSVDPLFKKASADFDEGGAKGLLLNHLTIDSNGRIVFDSSDDIEDVKVEGDSASRKSGTIDDHTKEIPSEIGEKGVKCASKTIDVVALGAKFFPDLARLDAQDICPSLKNFNLGDPTGSVDVPFLKAPDDWRQAKEALQSGGLNDQTGVFLDGDNVAGFEDDDGVLSPFDLNKDADFGEGGDAWAKHAAIGPSMQIQNPGFDDGGGEGQMEGIGLGHFNPGSSQYAPSLRLGRIEGGHEDILGYFDNALHKNWAGPEHWRIKRVKEINGPAAPTTSRRREKEVFQIDFAAPLDTSLAQMINTPASSNAAISLPKSQWKSKTRNLLPDDKHFNSKQLLRLFLKPKARMGSRKFGLGNRRTARGEDTPEGEVDEAFWARKETAVDQRSANNDVPQGNYDANFFEDDGIEFPNGPPDDDDDDFADARKALSPAGHIEGPPSQGLDGMLFNRQESQEGAFGTQLVTQSRRLRPEYVQYARVAKQVDVRRLKEEMWRGIGFEEHSPLSQAPKVSKAPPPKSDEESLKFTSIMKNLQQVYPKQAMDDISTSYCFICLLHLANEKGLEIANEPGLEELSIRKDFTAEIGAEDNA